MGSTAEALAARERVVTWTWRSLWAGLAATAVVVGGWVMLVTTAGAHEHGLQWVALVLAAMTADEGRSVAHARHMFGLVDPAQIRGWMRPLSIAFYIVGAVMVAISVWVLVTRHGVVR